MLLTNSQALEKANGIIRKIDKDSVVTDYFWMDSGDGKEYDIFIYYIKYSDNDDTAIPGFDYPLFLRNGEMTDFALLPEF